MRLTFLGGADEVGASCTLVEIAGRRLLVDCGIRMNAPDGDTLPWLAPIQERGGIDAIILTHAHMDHSGAMPVIHQSYPHVPVYMTAATLSLTTILLMDSLKIMQMESEREGEVPLYPLPAVEMFIGAARPVPLGQSVAILDGEIKLSFFPAGHIMGAAAVLIETREGTICMSGDVSITDQKTIPGMLTPPAKPDFVVVESTYGGRLHANRAAEEHRLISQVTEVLERRGGILFPAFAVGRAQEIILILSQAMERKRIPAAPIFVDGMVRQICQAYSSYPALMTPWLRKRTQKHGNPFFYKDGPAIAVRDPRKREAYAKTRPAIYVSSSGMLTGGPSPFYARHLVDEPGSFIAITGYQDEESPGRALQNVARAGGGQLRLGGETVTLTCGVGTYGLSAHADTAQIVGLMSSFQPKEIALVHGDGGAREALREALLRASLPTVHLPRIGDTITVQDKHVRRTSTFDQAPRSEAPASALLPEHLEALGARLLERDQQARLYTVQEILLAWGDQAGAHDEREIQRVSLLLQGQDSPFRPDRKRPFLYRLTPKAQNKLQPNKKRPGDKKAQPQKPSPKDGPIDAFNALQVVDKYINKSDGLYKRSSQNDQHTIVLSFHFPKVAQEKHRSTLETIAQETGWQITLRPTPHQGALAEAAQDVLPADLSLKKTPSIHLQEEKVVVQPATQPSLTQAQEAAEAFLQRTGFLLEFKGMPLPSPSATPSTGLPEAHDGSATEVKANPLQDSEAAMASQTAEASALPDGGEGQVEDADGAFSLESPNAAVRLPAAFVPGETYPQMEINAAYQAIREAFGEAPHPLLKVGLKVDVIEVSFISPQVGERYAEALSQLSTYTGWSIRVRERVDQHRVKAFAKELIPEAWGLRKEPGYFPDKQQVSAKITSPPSAQEQNDLCQAFFAHTGLRLLLKT